MQQLTIELFANDYRFKIWNDWVHKSPQSFATSDKLVDDGVGSNIIDNHTVSFFILKQSLCIAIEVAFIDFYLQCRHQLKTNAAVFRQTTWAQSTLKRIKI